MKTDLTKKQAEEKVKKFFSDIESKSQEEIRKIKRFASHYKIKLKDKRKQFCQKCYNNRFRILSVKKGFKRVKCEKCGEIYKWKIK